MGGLLGFTGDRLAHVISMYPLWEEVGEKWDYSRATGATFSEEKKWGIIEEDVATHHVSDANKVIVQWFKKIRRAEEKSEKGAMLQMFLYYHILKISRHFTTALGKFIIAANKRPHSDQFRIRVDGLSKRVLPKMIAAVQQAENLGGDDMKFFMGEMNDALKEGAGNFVDNWRTRAKRKKIGSRVVLMLERRAFRSDVTTEYQDMKMLERHAKELEPIDSQLQGNPKEETLKRMLNRFETILNASEKELIEMFKAAHIILRRWLFDVAVILSDEKLMEALGPKWIQRHFMQGSLSQRITDVRGIEIKLSGKLHGLANALNVHIKEMDALEGDFKRDLAEAA